MATTGGFWDFDEPDELRCVRKPRLTNLTGLYLAGVVVFVTNMTKGCFP